MRVYILGSGSALNSGRLFTSFWIGYRETELLIDPGPTCYYAVKKLGLDLLKLNAILVTHYHADHVFGLPFIMLELAFSGDVRDVRLILPNENYGEVPTGKAYIEKLMTLAYPDVAEKVLETLKLDVIQLPTDEVTELLIGELKIKAIPAKHTIPALSYVIQSDSRTVLISGDTEYNSHLSENLKGAELALLDISTPNFKLPGHMNLEDMKDMDRSKIVGVHLGKAFESNLSGIEGITLAPDLTVIEV